MSSSSFRDEGGHGKIGEQVGGRRAAFGSVAVPPIWPQPGCSFSNCEKEEPTYCTVRTEKKFRTESICWLNPMLPTAWNFGAVGRRLPSARPPTITVCA